ncbi:hypothetical protein D3C72_2517430 [compost metagenome]
MLGGQFAHQFGTSLVFVRRAVGEVQAGHIQTRDDQLLEDFGRIARRSKGGDDFGAAKGHAQAP